jgi:hypothetical protein
MVTTERIVNNISLPIGSPMANMGGQKTAIPSVRKIETRGIRSLARMATHTTHAAANIADTILRRRMDSLTSSTTHGEVKTLVPGGHFVMSSPDRSIYPDPF